MSWSDQPDDKMLEKLIRESLDGELDIGHAVDIIRTKTRLHMLIEYRNRHGRLPRGAQVREILGAPPRGMVGEQLLAGLLENA